MVQENGTRNGEIGNGADCQELWGGKGVLVARGGGTVLLGVMSWGPPPSGTSQRGLQSPEGQEWERRHSQVSTARWPALPLSLAQDRPLEPLAAQGAAWALLCPSVPRASTGQGPGALLLGQLAG